MIPNSNHNNDNNNNNICLEEGGRVPLTEILLPRTARQGAVSSFKKRISSTSSNRETSARWGFPTVSSPLPSLAVGVHLVHAPGARACVCTVDFRNLIVFWGAETLSHWNPTSCQTKTSTINLFGFETLKLKIRRLKLWKPTVIRISCMTSSYNIIAYAKFDTHTIYAIS